MLFSFDVRLFSNWPLADRLHNTNMLAELPSDVLAAIAIRLESVPDVLSLASTNRSLRRELCGSGNSNGDGGKHGETPCALDRRTAHSAPQSAESVSGDSPLVRLFWVDAARQVLWNRSKERCRCCRPQERERRERNRYNALFVFGGSSRSVDPHLRGYEHEVERERLESEEKVWKKEHRGRLVATMLVGAAVHAGAFTSAEVDGRPGGGDSASASVSAFDDDLDTSSAWWNVAKRRSLRRARLTGVEDTSDILAVRIRTVTTAFAAFLHVMHSCAVCAIPLSPQCSHSCVHSDCGVCQFGLIQCRVCASGVRPPVETGDVGRPSGLIVCMTCSFTTRFLPDALCRFRCVAREETSQSCLPSCGWSVCRFCMVDLPSSVAATQKHDTLLICVQCALVVCEDCARRPCPCRVAYSSDAHLLPVVGVTPGATPQQQQQRRSPSATGFSFSPPTGTRSLEFRELKDVL
jgi:hypothetical protein